ncbi:MAG TPA: SDR family oxidoreductase [Bellilinea sp.]|nr:SDR family oxidoreductase [Bellilinea sp.]
MKLEGKVVVITGGGSGMGRAMANLFSDEGAKVVIGDWNENSMNEVIAELQAKGREVAGLKVNVAKQEDSEALIDLAVQKFGRLDVLCNNAGVMDLNAGVAEVTNEMWERVIGVNVTGPMYLSRKAVQIMRDQKYGVIINTASVAGVGGAAAGAAYTVSKHGIVGLTKNTAWRYVHDGIRCNAIAAGAVETNIMQSVDLTKMDQAALARSQVYYGCIPAQLQAIDIAKLALFLASDDARYINGVIIPADGGWRAA